MKCHKTGEFFGRTSSPPISWEALGAAGLAEVGLGLLEHPSLVFRGKKGLGWGARWGPRVHPQVPLGACVEQRRCTGTRVCLGRREGACLCSGCVLVCAVGFGRKANRIGRAFCYFRADDCFVCVSLQELLPEEILRAVLAAGEGERRRAGRWGKRWSQASPGSVTWCLPI